MTTWVFLISTANFSKVLTFHRFSFKKICFLVKMNTTCAFFNLAFGGIDFRWRLMSVVRLGLFLVTCLATKKVFYLLYILSDAAWKDVIISQNWQNRFWILPIDKKKESVKRADFKKQTCATLLYFSTSSGFLASTYGKYSKIEFKKNVFNILFVQIYSVHSYLMWKTTPFPRTFVSKSTDAELYDLNQHVKENLWKQESQKTSVFRNFVLNFNFEGMFISSKLWRNT